MHKKLTKNITVYGSTKNIEVAENALAAVIDASSLHSEGENRLRIQKIIDEQNLKADVMYDGNTVWSKTRIIRNLKRIIKHGVLYDRQKPRMIPIGSMLQIPATGKTILSKYFYQFLHLCCGSIAHYDINGWVCQYPTIEDLKQFFKHNEFGKRVLDSIPYWHTDAREIVKEIEQLLEEK